MRFERIIRLTMLAGAALVLPGAAQASTPAAPGQAQQQFGQQSADDYQWIDQADALWDAIGDAPPDTAFAFEGQEPWAWQTGEGYTIIVEDAGEGGIRSYYFAPGATSPFLAVEPGMSFAFVNGRLAMVYDADGEAAPRSEFGDYDDAAEDLFDRGRRLYRALSARDYRPVDTDAWIDASPYLFGFIQLWDEGRTRYSGWGRYHDRSDAAAWRRRFEAEQRRRREQALRFSHWRAGGFQGPPPGRYHRPGTPGQPGRPGSGRPPQPGSGWSHQPGSGGSWNGGRPPQPGNGGSWNGGRPPQPGRPGRPGAGTPPVVTPGNPAPPPFTRPSPGRPDGSPDWRRGRPVMPPPGPAPIKQPVTDAPAPVADAPAPAPQPDMRPPRPRPEGGWRPRPAPAPSGAAPTPPAGVEVPPAPRPRPEGGWRPRPAPSMPDAAPPPQFRPRPSQPGFTPPAPRPSYTPPAPSAAPQPAPSRPSFTPPPPRASPPPPVSRPSPPPSRANPPPKIQRDSTKVD